jgi:hypothetical protein
MLKDVGVREYTMVYWTDVVLCVQVGWFSLARDVYVSFVAVVGASGSALGDRRVCVEVV